MPPKVLSQLQVDEIVAMTARGISTRAIARAYNVSHQTVYNYLKSPESQEKLVILREAIKHEVLKRVAGGLVNGTADLVEHSIREKDAKGVDASTRALLNLEKASVSASGEGKRVEVTGLDGDPLRVDVRAILAKLVESVASD